MDLAGETTKKTAHSGCAFPAIPEIGSIAGPPGHPRSLLPIHQTPFSTPPAHFAPTHFPPLYTFPCCQTVNPRRCGWNHPRPNGLRA
jgi:hypothetical protein